MANQSLLIELLTEELPPKSLARLSEAFSRNVFEGLKEKGFLSADSAVEPFATPRRLAVRVSGVLAKQPDRMVERKGPAVAAGYGADGQPTPALLGFAKSCGVEVTKLEKRQGDKGEQFVYSFKQKGELLAKHLAAVVETGLKKLPVAKMMRWGSGEAQFVRPVHGLIMLHGAKIISGEVLGIKSGRKTLGHRFLSKGAVTITHADHYEELLVRQGAVIARYETRAKIIEEQLDEAAKKLGKSVSWNIGKSADLVDEVTSLVECSAVYTAAFSEDFLAVPKECLITSMQQHQKYFPLEDGKGKLLPQFLFVSNIKTKTPKHIIHGNERVLRARLSDAKFFYDQDRKTKLADRVPRLANVVYHNKLGSQLERVERIQKLAGEIARRLVNADVAAAERAAYLAKADLLTDMVGEFPELQGIMGKYYAWNDKEPNLVAEAIEEHYFPRSSGGELPENDVAISVALADKLDVLVGIYGIGLVPTGEKDPFGLRRAALGVIRILAEKQIPLDVVNLLNMARSYFKGGAVSESVAQDLYNFILDRLKPYLFKERGFELDEIDAVLSLNPTRLDQLDIRLTALKQFRALPEAAALAAANKRIRNILRQAGGAVASEVDPALLTEEAEKKLATAVQALHGQVVPMLKSGDYAKALKQLATLRPAVDEFFDKVMVMADDMAVRNNRLALLNSLSNLFLHVADISRLQG